MDKLYKCDFFNGSDLYYESKIDHLSYLQRNRQETFVITIIQWIPKTKKGVKKSAAIKRFKGSVSNYDAVLYAAQEFIDRMNQGSCKCALPRQKPFTVTVK